MKDPVALSAIASVLIIAALAMLFIIVLSPDKPQRRK